MDRMDLFDAQDLWVEGVTKRVFGNDAPQSANFGTIARQIVREAGDRAAAAGIMPQRTDDGIRLGAWGAAVDDAFEPVMHLYWAMKDPSFPRPTGELWRHQRQIPYQVKNKEITEYWNRPEIEGIVGDYIARGHQTKAADRLFVDVLIAMEVVQFTYTQLHPNPYGPGSVLKRKPLLEFFGWRAASAVVLLIVFLICWGLSLIGFFPDSWVFGVGLLGFGIFVLESAWALIMLPRQWMVISKAQKRINALFDGMNNAYTALGSDGPISGQHVRRLLDSSTDLGAVWPAPVYVLLDDIQKRGGSF